MKLRTLEEQIGGRCKHFNGVQHRTCDKGVVYDDIRLEGVPGLPCFRGKMNGGKPCRLCEFPTAEEVEAECQEIRDGFDQTTKARAAIVAHLGGPWKKGMAGSSGRIDCPACGKPQCLTFSRSGYNGHIHAKCSTDNCVAWME